MVRGFFGDQRWLSNFWLAPVIIDPVTFSFIHESVFKSFEASTNEHAFQALKCANILDFERILMQSDPVSAKRMGRRVQLIEGWDKHKLEIMEHVTRAKFTQHNALRLLLIQTDGLIEETNTWHDTFWGACVCARCNGGHNHLGNILMRVRAELSC